MHRLLRLLQEGDKSEERDAEQGKQREFRQKFLDESKVNLAAEHRIISRRQLIMDVLVLDSCSI